MAGADAGAAVGVLLLVGGAASDVGSKGLANDPLTNDELRIAFRCMVPVQHTFPRSRATPRSTRSLYLGSLFGSQRRRRMMYDGKEFGDMFHDGFVAALTSASSVALGAMKRCVTVHEGVRRDLRKSGVARWIPR